MPDFFDTRNHLLSYLSTNYVTSDVDESSNPRYYGYLSNTGAWIIMEQNTATGAVRYAQGKSDYPTNYTGRTGLTYTYYNLLNTKY